MKKLVFFLLLFCLGGFAFSQENLSPEQVTYFTDIKNNLSGTYQIQMVNTRSLPTIELSFFKIIEESRQSSETVYITINPNCRVKVLSQEEIDQQNFVPLDYITFINEAN